MVDYKCLNCGEITKEIRGASGSIQCPKCDHKLFLKVRAGVAKKVKAR
ncbi:TPA: DNA-directed RNA polymerase subunit P [archaeon]|nr:DNA-directed RNA polymerase subunit P [Candidatus Naiadarchaeales archaeon SRR2090159.bin1288]